MVSSVFLAGLIALAPLASAAPRGQANDNMDLHLRLRGDKPVFPPAPNTVSTCSWWWDNDGSIPCGSMPAEWGITMENFLKWNPSITSSCGNFLNQRAYCVEAPASPPAEGPATTTTTAPATTTAPSNGITTPTPIQPGMVNNCNKFHFVNAGCSDVLSDAKVTLAQLFAWNPTVRSDCTGLWAGVNVCVGVIGQAPPPATTTTPSNGVSTPSPIQPGMVTNCNLFHFIGGNTQCQQVLDYQKISLADFFKWNPAVKADCSGLQKDTHACVRVIGGTTPPTATTTTPPGNGIATPTPIQPGMVTNCNLFHFIGGNTQCQQVLDYQRISLADFFRWNPAVRADCSGLQKDTHACVRVIGGSTPPTPTTTTRPGNGVATPTPIQAGMVTNCKTFHFIGGSTTCQQVLDYQRITLANFFKWNPAVKADCSGLWTGTHACVAVL
ncbi:LysM domain-containing protein [Plectosphaerella plurivora]|uniref:LysM domain-containing protein n=1 Tax=Plectosphaerella plurivora TaxID=936078 RepID=A0A9P9AE43_9PEZI|nr:LysM domain-containing protein [Plectosphaerella plurivora]